MGRVYETVNGCGHEHQNGSVCDWVPLGVDPIRKLIKITCDYCDASIEPGPHVVGSGWTTVGTLSGSEWDFCPQCWP